MPNKTITIPVNFDVTVDQDSDPDDTFGNDGVLSIGNFSHPAVRRTILRASLDAIPRYATIVTSKLWLHCDEEAGAEESFNIYRMDRAAVASLIETAVNWRGPLPFPILVLGGGGDPGMSGIAASAISYQMPPSSGWHNYPITAITQSGFADIIAARASGNAAAIGLLLCATDEDIEVGFTADSREPGHNVAYLEVTYSVPEGYLVYLCDGVPPNTSIDAPVALVSSANSSAVLSVASLGLLANRTYIGAVAAVNAFGVSSPAEFSFRTNGSAQPSFVPTPVRTLRATALSGRRIRIEWEYWETHGDLNLASDFLVTVASKDPVFDEEMEVAYTPHQREYEVIFPEPINQDALAEVRVHARRHGASQDTGVLSVFVRLDGTPPASVPAEITAV